VAPQKPKKASPGRKSAEQKKLEQNQKMFSEMANAAAKANEEVSFASTDSMVGNPLAKGTSLAGHLTDINDLDIGLIGTGRRHANSQAKALRFISECDNAYREVGLVRNVIDLMVDFSSEGLTVIHKDPRAQRFLQRWAEKVNMVEVAKQVLLGIYKWGNIGVFRYEGKINPKKRKELTRAQINQLKAGGAKTDAINEFIKEEKLSRDVIPIKYSIIPPFRIRISGGILLDGKIYVYRIAERDRRKLREPEKFATKEEQLLITKMDKTLRQELIDNAQVIIPNKNFHFFQYKRSPDKLWADPLLLPVLSDLRYKQTLRRMDRSVAESVINPITLFKLGNTAEGFPPTQEAFQKLAAILKTPVTTKNLIWSDLIEVEMKSHDVHEVLNMDKYEQVNKDILAGLGVAEVLVSGGKTNFSTAFLSVKTLIERLEDGRSEFLKFLQPEVNRVVKAMGFKGTPKIIWGQMNLRDEAAEKRIVIELLDRSVISSETALEQLGFDNEIEDQRKKRETKQEDVSGIPKHVGPFERNDPRVIEKEFDAQEESQKQQLELKKQQQQQQQEPVAPKKNGRPADQGDEDSRKQKIKRETKPQGMGSLTEAILVEKADKIRHDIEAIVKPKYLKSVNKKNLRQLTTDEKTIYEELVFQVFAKFQPNEEVNEITLAEKAHDLTTAPPKLDRCVNRVKKELVAEFHEKNGKEPSAKKRRELESKAFAICRAQLGI
jgi:hypothetical protein